MTIPEKPETYSVAVLSCNHLPKYCYDHCVKAAEESKTGRFVNHGFGFTVSVTPPLSDQQKNHLAPLLFILHWAKQQGYKVVDFESDAHVINALPFFSWPSDN